MKNFKKFLSLFLLVAIFVTSINSITMANSLTAEGNANLLDSVDDEGKQFLTVQSRDGNIYYIIIDNQKEENNVYFLNAVDEIDLLSFATDATGNNYHLTGAEVFESTTELTTEPTTRSIEITTEEIEQPTTTTQSSKGIGIMPIICLIAIVFVILFYFYTKRRRKAKNDDEEYANDDEISENDNDSDDNDYSDFFNSDDDNN